MKNIPPTTVVSSTFDPAQNSWMRLVAPATTEALKGLTGTSYHQPVGFDALKSPMRPLGKTQRPQLCRYAQDCFLGTPADPLPRVFQSLRPFDVPWLLRRPDPLMTPPVPFMAHPFGFPETNITLEYINLGRFVRDARVTDTGVMAIVESHRGLDLQVRQFAEIPGWNWVDIGYDHISLDESQFSELKSFFEKRPDIYWDYLTRLGYASQGVQDIDPDAPLQLSAVTYAGNRHSFSGFIKRVGLAMEAAFAGHIENPYQGDFVYAQLRPGRHDFNFIKNTGVLPVVAGGMMTVDSLFDNQVAPFSKNGILTRIRVPGPFYGDYDGADSGLVRPLLSHYVIPEFLMSTEARPLQWGTADEFFEQFPVY